MADAVPPSAAVAWTRHLQRYAGEPGAWVDASEAIGPRPAGERQEMARHVAALDLPDPRGAMFRAVFLYLHTGDVAALSAAARAVAQAGELERLHAWLAWVWGMAAMRADDRAHFRAILEAAGFPGLTMRAARALTDVLPAPAGKPGAGCRIAVLCQHLSGFAHAGTRLALEHAALLSAAGHDVCVFSAQELANAGIAGWLGCPSPPQLAPPVPESWKPVSAAGPCQAWIAPHAWPVLLRWQSAAVNMAAFAPDAVLFVGFFSPLLEWAHRHFPVAGLSVHTLPPLGPVDVWLHQFDTEALPAPWSGIVQPEPFAYAHRFVPPPARALSLASLNLPPDARLAVSVGYRLSSEITAEWAAQALARLARHKQWVWLLVGDPHALQGVGANHSQVRVLPHQEHIDALLAQCHLYLNPPRMGGGFSVMNAMAHGVAAVSLSGSDGGDKLGPWTVASPDEYWQRVDTFLADDAARARCGRELAQRFRTLYDLRAATPRLVAALDAARARFAKRGSG